MTICFKIITTNNFIYFLAISPNNGPWNWKNDSANWVHVIFFIWSNTNFSQTYRSSEAIDEFKPESHEQFGKMPDARDKTSSVYALTPTATTTRAQSRWASQRGIGKWKENKHWNSDDTNRNMDKINNKFLFLEVINCVDFLWYGKFIIKI
jgi:hypothetical protein